MLSIYRFHPHLVLRTPARPFTQPLTAEALQQSLLDDGFMEALLLASPVLHTECLRWQRGEITDAKRVARLQSSLTRYYSRMMTRCTPFGLFAGCSLAQWGAESRVVLAPGHDARHTRLDMHYLCALAQHLAANSVVRPRLRYWPNSSWYQLGEEVRYIEQQYADRQPVHQISAIESSETIMRVLQLCAEGLTYTELVTLLAEEEAEQAAVGFVEALIDAQLLVSELEPTVTGPEFLTHLQRVVARLQAEAPHPYLLSVAQLLAEVTSQLRALDQRLVNPAAAYHRLEALMQELGVATDAAKLFQVDARPGSAPGATIAHSWQAALRVGIEALSHLAPPHHNQRLEEFKQQFQLRYEDREVPLLEALDTESGIPYSSYGKESYSPLTHDLELPASADQSPAAHLSAVQKFMQQKLREAARCGHYVVELSLDEIQHFSDGQPALPPSLGVLFRFVGDGLLQLDSVGGSSAVNLLGRFAHATPAIGQLIQEITQAEQAHNPEVIFAELCHLPASRVGNILQRPHFRKAEIPYLAQSRRPASEQIRAQDLTLSLRHGQLELRSRSTRQRIIPRLSTAHNYTHDALPVYELLCDLQTQGIRTQLAFSWHERNSQFLPRLVCGQVVLAVASWHLRQADVASLLVAGSAAELAASLHLFRQYWKIPRFFILADGDNELLVDTDNPLLVQTWLEAVRQRPAIRLKEFLFEAATSLVHNEAGQPYSVQGIALLVREEPCYTALEPLACPQTQVQRDFALGSEWLYYKLYCGPQVANRILREAIYPLTRQLEEEQLIDKWFFVRYADPASHLRLRLHLADTHHLGQVVAYISQYLAPCSQSGYIWKIQNDTYQRELERYGSRTIALSEQLFHYQSVAYLDHLVEAALPQSEEAYWHWGLQALDELLTAFDYSLTQKIALLGSLRDAFGQEFGLNKALRLQLDAKFRAARPALWAALDGSGAPRTAPLAALAQAIGQQAAAQPAEVSLPHLLRSYTHMLLNRVLPAEARLHELVLYDFLYRYYQSCHARHKAQA